MVALIDLWDTLEDIGKEYLHAKSEHSKFNSYHEAYAVLLEEMDELWEQIKLLKYRKDLDELPRAKIKKEATQIAAMALGIIYEFEVDEGG